MFKYLIFIFALFFFNIAQTQQNSLSLKQQVERIQRELNDLSKSVYKGERDQQKISGLSVNENHDLTAIDFRIYEIEKDIKKINEIIEELSFEIEDFKNTIDDLILNISTEKIHNNVLTKESDSNVNSDDLVLEENLNAENTLGTLIIKSEDLSNDKNDDEISSENSFEDISLFHKESNIVKLDPELEFQSAFELLKNQKFTEAKNSLELFIINHIDHELAGSAHYWLGEIYLLKKEYREAALVFAEGYQKYPKSLKSPDMLYKLSEALINIGKKEDGCNTLEKFKIEFPGHKLFNKTEKKIISLECNIFIE